MPDNSIISVIYNYIYYFSSWLRVIGLSAFSYLVSSECWTLWILCCMSRFQSSLKECFFFWQVFKIPMDFFWGLSGGYVQVKSLFVIIGLTSFVSLFSRPSLILPVLYSLKIIVSYILFRIIVVCGRMALFHSQTKSPALLF